MSNGKGDTNRKMSISRDEWDKRYEAIFKKEKTEKEKDDRKS